MPRINLLPHREQERKRRRREFGAFGWVPMDVPDPQDPATFQRSKLTWDELDDPAHRELFAWYRELIRTAKAGGTTVVG